MEQALSALGGLFLKALPTFLLILFLHVYLKQFLYKPLDKVLKERSESTAGYRKLAEESLAAADRKTREYEEALRHARGEIYREQEEMRKQWQQEQASALQAARRSAEAQVAEAKASLAAEAEAASRALEAEADSLAEQITRSVLARRAA